MPYQSFEELKVWQEARQLKNDIATLVKQFPPEEKYRLVDQLIRSSRSVGTQIVEGHGRRSFPERIRYCIISRGSLSETTGHLIDAFDAALINEEQLTEFRKKIDMVEKLLSGYISWLEKQG
jgi:four helix bundle protein